MAETLGSLIDKLSIKNLRYWHLNEAIRAKDAPDSKIVMTKRNIRYHQSGTQ